MTTTDPYFVTYTSSDETIITTKELEAHTVEIYFLKGGRDIDDYERQEFFEEIIVTTTLKVN